MSPTPLSDDTSKISSDDVGDANSRGKMFNLNQCVSRPFPTNGSDGGSNALDSNGVSGDGMGNENKLKKVKLKVGGVTRTIQTNSNSNGASGSASSAKTNQSSDSRQRQKLILQEHSDEYHSPAQDKKSGIQGIPWKGFSKGGFGLGKEDKGRMLAKSAFEKQGDKSDPVRKSKRMPRTRVLDEEFDEDDQDDEIRYLEKLKTAKIAGYKDTNTESTRKQRKDGKLENIEGTGKSGRDFKETKPDDMDYEEEELLSDGEHEGKKKKKQKKDLLDLPVENKREMALTTRQRALLSKDTPSASGASQIEFPNGLPPAPSRKQKEKLSEMEQQLKKAEIAQRRKMQNEKAARESEAEAIRKILGQDSSRKKREDKVKKRLEELAQEKVASAHMLASSTIRWVMGPTGTTVTFPQDMGFPKIFESKLCSYPPPREKCAGPSCTNPYKYRDSKSKLPLCSLQCYKAIHEKMQVENAF
ncbi:unnamed protein product [Fraxinus pennsylvanica]|uniref:INO80 complex subunit B-like conserved region domain-containing protein n=1 Tax=Fraxinus pennsylvanica TaxID=56036 RepID=A0AAD2DRS5_9LAMI|nr:unnamed protein product [Fraxinus pennsylvanica]